MNISCFNPVFIGHEDNDGDVLDKQTKTDSMVPKLVEIQVTDSIGGLNPQRHTVVSFNKKESVGGDHLRKKNATNSGGTKSRTLGTVVNKDGGFGAIKKINKITHGKGINFKNKISSKVPLSDSMSRLAQTVSILQGDISEVVGPDSGCASSKFLRVFHEYNLEHKPDIVCLLEPRASGKKANAIIDKLSFDFSHHIESIGFAGNIVFNSFYIFVMYGSPDRVKRKTLWTDLLESICKPRCRVGLGLRHLYDQNNSFLMKIAFNLISQKDALWVRVLRSNLNFECNLRDWVLPDGTLNLDLVRLWLSEDIVIHIVSIRPPHPGGGIDRIIWARSDDSWNLVWKYQGPQRRLLTNAECFRRGIGQSSVCSLCGHDFEDILHVLLDCKMAKEAWMLIVPVERRFRFFSDPFQIWFSTNLSCYNKLQDKGITWSCLFGIVAWRLWKNRNLFIFQYINWSASETIKSFLSWALHFEPFFIEAKTTVSNHGVHHHLADNWAHLFTDGAVARDSGNAAARSVIRDRSGNWILGFTHYLGRCSPLEAELWGILDGILVSLSKSYKKVRIQSDSLEVVKALSMEVLVDSGNTILRRVKRLLRSEGQWEIKNSFRFYLFPCTRKLHN
ncbi:hypothetical protein V6Z11_A09G125900 [Gossypium hirsutum]